MQTNLNLSSECVADVERLMREISVIIKRKGREILGRFPITPPQLPASTLMAQ